MSAENQKTNNKGNKGVEVGFLGTQILLTVDDGQDNGDDDGESDKLSSIGGKRGEGNEKGKEGRKKKDDKGAKLGHWLIMRRFGLVFNGLADPGDDFGGGSGGKEGKKDGDSG